MSDLTKYPRTEHLEDSRLAAGDSEKDRARLSWLSGCWLVIEEKVDGANSAISFVDGQLRLQSRGHFLSGGGSEAQFSWLKAWASTHERALRDTLAHRFIMYGESMMACHSLYYDQLPHAFIEFDVWDRERGLFLNTLDRQKLLSGLPVVQAPVLYEGFAPSRLRDLKALVGPSLFRSSNWRDSLRQALLESGQDPSKLLPSFDRSDLMEGFYVKVETVDATVARFKWVRPDFVQTILDSGKHWSERPMILNRLASDVDLHAEQVVDSPGLFGRQGGVFKAWATRPPQSAQAPCYPSRRIRP